MSSKHQHHGSVASFQVEPHSLEKVHCQSGIATNDGRMLVLPCTPSPPPLYHSQWLHSPSESVDDFPQHIKSSICDGCSVHSQDLMKAMNGGNGAKLFEVGALLPHHRTFLTTALQYALAQLQQDQATLLVEDSQFLHNRNHRSTMVASPKAAKKQRDSHVSDQKRPPTFVSTHSATYRQAASNTTSAMDSKPSAAQANAQASNATLPPAVSVLGTESSPLCWHIHTYANTCDSVPKTSN